MVNYTGRRGAGSALAFEATRTLLERGHSVVAVISADAENIDLWKSLPLEKLIVIRTYRSTFDFVLRTIHFLIYGMWALRKRLKEFNIKAVYCPMIQPWTIFINLMIREAKSIVTIHDPVPHSGSRNYAYEFLAHLCGIDADKIVILTDEFRGFCSRKYKKDASEIFCIPHPDFQYYRRLQIQRKLVDYSNDDINFLFFGRLLTYKGLSVLAKAYRIVCAEESNITMTIAGSGNFSQFEREFEGARNVRILNRWFDDTEVGAIFDGPNLIVVLPYLDSTQSGVIPIAIEYGVPIIASRTGGLSKQIVHDVSGLLVEPSDPEALALAMLDLARHERKRRALATNASELSVNSSWDTFYTRLMGIINE